MKALEFTQEELHMIKFVITNDLETVQNSLDVEGEAEEWQKDKAILISILSKLDNLLE